MSMHTSKILNVTDHGLRNPRSGRSRYKATQVDSTRNPCDKRKEDFKIGTWNVRTMLKTGKLDEVKEQMKKVELDILGICETRWTGNGDFKSEEFRVIHSGGERRGKNGVAVILRGKWKDNVLNTYHLSDRLLMVKIEAKPTNVYIIQVYFPTSRSTIEEVEDMYEQIEELLQITEKNANVFIMGDFNAQVGCVKSSNTGSFGLGNRNERGERLVEFCQQQDMIVANTYFEVPFRRRYTWKAPGDINRYQIDFVLVKTKFRNQVKLCYSYPGCDVDSDHNLVLAKCNIRFKKRMNAMKNKKWNLEKLKDDKTCEEFKQEMDKENMESNGWESMKENIKKVADKILGKHKLEPRKPWMTREILDLIVKRNQLRNRDYEEYKRVKNEVTTKCKQAKEEWLKQNIEDIESDMRKNNTGRAYNKVKKMQYKPKTRSNIIKGKDGKILFENEKVAERWKEYIEELYEGQQIENEEEYIENEQSVNEDCLGPDIMRSEFNKALKELSSKKATGIDQIPAEILQNLGQKSEDLLFNIIQESYKEGTLPSDFIKSKTITLPKKGNASECGNYRTIALLSHASKILLNTIKNRLKEKVETNIEDDQFGFRRGRGTREAILALRQILERRISTNRDTFATFIDLEKAFDKVDWKILFKTLKEKGIDWRDRRLIFKLYKDQKTEIDVNGSREDANIRKGVRQGCPLSPYLFNLFIEASIDAMKVKTRGVKINGQKIHCIRFADDIVILADSEKEMNDMLKILAGTLQKFHLKINAQKTKTMLITKNNTDRTYKIKLNNTELQQVKEFCYLGSIITNENKSTPDIKRRIMLAKQAFQNKNQLLTNKHLSIDIRKKFIKTYVWSVLTYGCETWTMEKRDRERLEAAEMWMWRRMTKTTWTERKSNVRVLEEVQERRQLIKTIELRKIKLIGHIIRHNDFISNIFEGKVTGKKSRGRPRKQYFQEIQMSMNCKSFNDLKNVARNRKDWLQRQGIAFSN